MALRIVVSYAYTDMAFTKDLVDALRHHGADVWYAKHPHDTMELAHTISEEIRARRVFLAVLSPSALQSHVARSANQQALSRFRQAPNRIAVGIIVRPLLGVSPATLRRVHEIPCIGSSEETLYSEQDLIHRVLCALGLIFTETKDTDAEQELASVLPDATADEWLIFGQTCYQQQRIDEAITALKRATILMPEHALPWAYLGLAYANVPNKIEAIYAFSRARELGFSPAWVWSNEAAMLADLDRYEEALRAADAAIALSHSYAHPWLVKGNSLRGLGRYQEALDAYEQGLVAQPKSPQTAKLWAGKAATLKSLFRDEEALLAWDHALAINPRYTYALYGKAKALRDQHREDEALAIYDQLVEADSANIQAWIDKADTLHDIDRYDEALAASEEALRQNARHAEAWNVQGHALTGLNRYEEALAAYQQALRLKPNSGAIIFNIGSTLMLLDRLSEFEEMVKQTIDSVSGSQ